MEDIPPLEKDEYEIQFYDKSVREMFIELSGHYKESLEETVPRVLKGVEKQLSGKKKELAEEQQKMVPQLMQDLEQGNQKQLKKVQLMMEKKIFHIPDDVVLPEDRCQVMYDQKDASKVEKDIEQLLARYEAVRYMKESCRMEIESFETLFQTIKTLIDEAEVKIQETENNIVPSSSIAALGQIKTLL